LPPTEAEAERLIKRLREQLGVARAELREMRKWYRDTGIPERGGMSLTVHRTIMKALHASRPRAERGGQSGGMRGVQRLGRELKPARRR
jgi:hypothetical protein